MIPARRPVPWPDLLAPDPDRFLDFRTPGSQEWWYFDAISDDGRDTLVLVWYAALPFDPAYGVAALRHLRDSGRHAAPRPLDHCALGVSWYRDGRTRAYALNGYRAGDFKHTAEPFSVTIAGNALRRDPTGYDLEVRTPAVAGRRSIRARLRYQPAAGTIPLEHDLGTEASPHLWMLAAADCRVEGELAVEGPGGHALRFRGRGYHDHNAGSEEISRAMRRWSWGRVHAGSKTQVYYHAEPRRGRARRVWITLEGGRPVAQRRLVHFHEEGPRTGNIFGVRHGRGLRVSDSAAGFTDHRGRVVDDGPFYRRWVGPFTPWGQKDVLDGQPRALGISELLDTRNLHHPLFNWMIPFRLKRPGGDPRARA